MKLSAADLARLAPPLRILVFLLVLVLLWLPLALPLYGLAASEVMPLGGAIATGFLYVVFLVLWPIWARRVHRLKRPWRSLGWLLQPEVTADWLLGLCLGLGGIVALVGIELVLGWATPMPAPQNLFRIILEGGLVAVAVGLAEETLFRGWFLFEMEQGLTSSQALWGTSLVFAVAHFIKPLPDILATLPQFFGLFLLGMALAWARRTPSHASPVRTALGYPMGLHSGLVWGYYLLNVGQVAKLTQAVPAWVTGLQGNPLAGLLGLGLLGGLATLFYRSSH
ncbi:MAG TPA: CPBP family intramembrane glutamic endopeptidase [Trichocoleus sp.]